MSGLILGYGVKMAGSKTATNAQWLTERLHMPLKNAGTSPQDEEKESTQLL